MLMVHYTLEDLQLIITPSPISHRHVKKRLLSGFHARVVYNQIPKLFQNHP